MHVYIKCEAGTGLTYSMKEEDELLLPKYNINNKRFVGLDVCVIG
jgi:hypothetical protein